LYQIFNDRRGRMRTDYIIISQARNLYENTTHLSPDVRFGGSYVYTWGAWQRYFHVELKRRSVPCHFFTELIGDDYAVLNGVGLTERSYFIDDLADNYVIYERYRHSLLVLVGDDFSYQQAERRMIEHLCDKVLGPMAKEYGLDRSRIVSLDDCLMAGWRDSLASSRLRYDVQLGPKLDMDNIRLIYNEYKK
jgi:hypothetical protein